MATRNLIVSMFQGKSKSAMDKAFDNANSVAAKKEGKGKK